MSNDIDYRQASAPTGTSVGTLWQDTDDSRIYRLESTGPDVWVQISAIDAELMARCDTDELFVALDAIDTLPASERSQLRTFLKDGIKKRRASHAALVRADQRRAENDERDRQILAEAKAGKPQKTIAIDHKISEGRVSQILRKPSTK